MVVCGVVLVVSCRVRLVFLFLLCVCVSGMFLFLQTALHLAAAGDHVDAVINSSVFTPTLHVCTYIYINMYICIYTYINTYI